ncbi:MAG: leucine-rich repeat domain-containing protein [Clostridia bacterium]|nr:leucine-rich repeat domain-containing protein [Clostridia bacterium]
MKRTLSLFLALLLLLVTVPPGTFTASALSFGQTGGCYWTISGHTLTITGAGAMAGYDPGDAPWYESRSSITAVNITDDVTEIGDAAFYGCSNVTSVSIGSSVAAIGSFAFSGCSGLTGVAIPTSVTSIGEEAFSGCSSLTAVAIPNNVTMIGRGAERLHPALRDRGRRQLQPVLRGGCRERRHRDLRHPRRDRLRLCALHRLSQAGEQRRLQGLHPLAGVAGDRLRERRLRRGGRRPRRGHPQLRDLRHRAVTPKEKIPPPIIGSEAGFFYRFLTSQTRWCSRCPA